MNKSNNTEYGRTGEAIAEIYLKKNGYRVIAGNYIVPGGELDLVAFKKGVLVYAEVKTRSSFTFGTPADGVTSVKRQRLAIAADFFKKEQSPYGKIPVYSKFFHRHLMRTIKSERFDIIEVFMPRSTESPKINHIKNAF